MIGVNKSISILYEYSDIYEYEYLIYMNIVISIYRNMKIIVIILVSIRIALTSIHNIEDGVSS